MKKQFKLLSSASVPIRSFAPSSRRAHVYATLIRVVATTANRRLSVSEPAPLKDWTATGDAFNQQPVMGDSVAPRRGDMKSNHRGNYWVGTYEVAGDKPQGTLTCAPFKVTQPYASFLVGGGSLPGTRVELVRADNQEVFFKVSGNDTENMHPVVVDLQKFQGVEIFAPRSWTRKLAAGISGHINFDGCHFYAEESRRYPDQIDPNAQSHAMSAADVFQHNGVSPEEAVKIMTLPPGFKAQLFVNGEPDIKRPIAFAIDDRRASAGCGGLHP